MASSSTVMYSSVILAALSRSIYSLKVIARLPLVFSSLKAGAHFSNSTISPSKMDSPSSVPQTHAQVDVDAGRGQDLRWNVPRSW